MRICVRFLFFPAAAALCLGLAISATTFGAGGPVKPAASPKPDIQKKVWTNDDVERLNPDFVINGARQTTTDLATALPVSGVQPARAPISAVPSAPLDPQQNPRWCD